MNLEALKINELVFQIVISIAIFLAYLLVRSILSKVVSKRALLQDFDDTRAIYIRKVIRAATSIFFLVLFGIVWEISLEGLSVYIASILTVVGVGLFANWSIVSNITASVILFFFFPFKIGSHVKIMDGDNSAEGVVMGLSLFSIKIQCEDGTEIYYPNNIAIQKSIVHLKD